MPRQKSVDKKQIGVAIPPALIKKLKAESLRMGESMSTIVQRALESELPDKVEIVASRDARSRAA